jgi:hypothetical protein
MPPASDSQPAIPAPKTSTNTSTSANKSLPKIPAGFNPWTYNTSTGDILVCGEPLTGFERIIVILVSRHPENFKDPASFVREGEKPLSGWELELVEAARKFPVNLESIADFYPEHCPPPDKSQPLPQHPAEKKSITPHKSLPEIPTDRSP